jgi:hypothetical protein
MRRNRRYGWEHGYFAMTLASFLAIDMTATRTKSTITADFLKLQYPPVEFTAPIKIYII